jgi:hypothetical protein
VQSVQADNNNSNAMFLTFTTVQRNVAELSGAATEKENIALITKVVFRLLTSKVNNSS